MEDKNNQDNEISISPNGTLGYAGGICTYSGEYCANLGINGCEGCYERIKWENSGDEEDR